jgi:ORF6N domain
MNKQTEIIPIHNITGLIHSVRDMRVILDSDLAQLYAVATKRLNEQFRRNRNRFPEDFAFRLTEEEWMALRSQIATLSPETPDMRSQFATASKRNIGHKLLGLIRSLEAKRADEDWDAALPPAHHPSSPIHHPASGPSRHA